MTVFNAFWFGKPFNAFHWACIRSFVSRRHEYRLHVYEPMEVPGGVTLMDANEILPREKLFEIKNPVTGNPDVAPFSDLFRYKLLLDRGGWYVDVDTICLADHYPDQIRAWANENEEIEGKLVINAAQMCLPKGDPLARQLYQRCLQIGHHSELREDWGPNLLTRVIVEMRLPAAIFGTSASFYPIDWIGAVSLVLPGHKGNVERKRCAPNESRWRSFEAVNRALDGFLLNGFLRRAPHVRYFPVSARDRRNARRRCIFLTAAARLSASCFIASAISASRR